MRIMEKSSMTEAEREELLIRLMEEYRTSLIRMAYLYLGEVALAEDAVQETFLKAYAHMDKFRRESSEKTWLMRIAINTCIDMQRSSWMRWRKRTVPPEAVPECGQEDSYRDDTVIRAVMQLPQKDKQVLLLRYYQEMKVNDIAQTLGISSANVTSRLKRAKDKLREALKGWYFYEESL